MNISVQIKRAVQLIALIISPLVAFSQAPLFESRQLLTNQSFVSNFSAINAALSLQPKKGTAVLTNNKIIYTPTANFTGRDTFILTLMTFPPVQLLYKGFAVEIADSYINANPDYVITNVGQSINIEVLSNDNSTAPLQPLDVQNGITYVGNGTAQVISGSTIRFTPTPGFVGTTFLNYVVCNEYDYCKNGEVFITVSDAAQSEIQTLTTAKNQLLPIFLPSAGYAVSVAPTRGTLQLNAFNSYRYKPNNNQVGNDVVVFSKTVGAATVTNTVNITIIPAANPNQFVMDDYANTTINTPVAIKVQQNDVTFANFTIQNFTQPVSGGTVVNNGGDNFTFTPAPNFKGIAKFTYNARWNSPTAGIPYAGGTPQETATVSILVSNQAPAQTFPYQFVTPKNTAFVIDYSIPLSGYDFEVIDPAQHGTATYFAGNSSQMLNGQLITGKNLIIYTPNTNYVGNDEFQLRYCMNGDCRTVKVGIETLNLPLPSHASDFCVGSKCVWAGDANNDGIVSMSDLLPIGYCIGEVGVSRPDASVSWYGQFGDNWANPFIAQNSDLKHIDTDGNGFISSQDTMALSQFYGLTHNLTSDRSLSIKKLPLYFVQSSPVGVAQPGDLVQIDIILGKNIDPAINVSGLAFSFDYDASKVVDSLTQISFDNNSWINYASSTMAMTRKPWSGRLDAGLTRTGGDFASGYGRIGKMEVVIDDIAGFQLGAESYLRLAVSVPAVMDADGSEYAAESQVINLPIGSKKIVKTLDESLLVVSPNPTSGAVRIHLNGGYEIEKLLVFNIMGEAIQNTVLVNGSDANIDFGNAASGIYIVQTITKAGIINKKVEVVR